MYQCFTTIEMHVHSCFVFDLVQNKFPFMNLLQIYETLIFGKNSESLLWHQIQYSLKYFIKRKNLKLLLVYNYIDTFSLQKGDPTTPKDEVKLPEGWAWDDDWQIDLSRAVDEDGNYSSC